MAENSKITSLEGTAAQETSKDELQQTPLLPRSAWNSELTHLKLLLKAKQTLDKTKH